MLLRQQRGNTSERLREGKTRSRAARSEELRHGLIKKRERGKGNNGREREGGRKRGESEEEKRETRGRGKGKEAKMAMEAGEDNAEGKDGE